MSIVGTRPPLISETNLYEPRHKVNMAYLSIINANDYRKNIMTEEMAGIGVNLYRGYENKYSGSEYLKNARLPDLHKYVMGMSYEQFKYENPEWVYQNFNRNYHILIGSLSINRDGLVDANMITKEIFEFTVEETLALEWAVLWLCYNCPFPLSLPEKVYRKKDERILTKNNIERINVYFVWSGKRIKNLIVNILFWKRLVEKATRIYV